MMLAHRFKQAGYAAVLIVGLLGLQLILAQLVLHLIPEAIKATIALDAVLVLAILIFRRRAPQYFSNFWGQSKDQRMIPSIGWLVVAGFVFAFIAGQTLSSWLYSMTGSANYDDYTATQHNANILLVLALTVVVAPIAEETLLRGFLYPLMRRKLGVLPSVLLTTAVFMLLHGNLVQAAVVFPLGILLALVYEHTRSLALVVLLHVGFNVCSVFTPATLIGVLSAPILIACWCAAFAASAWWLAPRTQRTGSRP